MKDLIAIIHYPNVCALYFKGEVVPQPQSLCYVDWQDEHDNGMDNLLYQHACGYSD